MSIEGDGFLSDAGVKIANNIVLKNLEKFKYLEFVINELRKFVLSMEVNSQETEEEKQKIISLILSIRLLEITESSLLVMKHGMSNEANSMFRIFLDAYFVLANVCSDKSFVANYFKSDVAARLKLLNSAKKHDSDLFKKINDYASKAIKDELETKITEENIQAFNSYAYAENVGCAELYDSMYRLMSAALHTTPRSLEKYVIEDENDIVISINYFPIEADIPQRIFDFACHLIKILSGLKELFGYLVKDEIAELLSKLENIYKNET